MISTREDSASDLEIKAILCRRCVRLELLWCQNILHTCEFQLVSHEGLHRSPRANGRCTFSDSLSILKHLKFPFSIDMNRHTDRHARVRTHTHTQMLRLPVKAAWNTTLSSLLNFFQITFSKLSMPDDLLWKINTKEVLFFPPKFVKGNKDLLS